MSARPLIAHAYPNMPHQSYGDHIASVHRLGLIKAEDMLRWYTGPVERRETMRRVIENALIFHDMGKLHPIFQDMLYKVPGGFNINHVDAGIGVMMNMYYKSGDRTFLYAAILIESHHIGIFNKRDDSPFGYDHLAVRKSELESDYLRDKRTFLEKYKDRMVAITQTYPDINPNERICDHFTVRLGELSKLHLQESHLKPVPSLTKLVYTGDFTHLELKFMGSCLYFADHTDSAKHSHPHAFALTEDEPTFPLRAAERLALLDKQMIKLEDKARKTKKNGDPRKDKKAGKRSDRNQVRHMLYRDCRKVKTNGHFYINPGYVGTGKTPSCVASALQLAVQNDLRGIMYVAPFTGIIGQTADSFRSAGEYSIILPDEIGKEEHVVAAHHHKNDYRDQIVKTYNVSWTSPFVCTTSVQTVESLASNQTVLVKKLVNMAGRAIILDEFDNSMAYWMWGIFGNWVKELADNWSCYFIFSSGSTVNLWDIPVLNIPDIKPVDLLSKATHRLMKKVDRRRVHYRDIGKKPLDEILTLLSKAGGPTNVVLNTVQNCAVVAVKLQEKFGKGSVLMLSTALTPTHQKRVITEAKKRLKEKTHGVWFFVTTSSSECGINLSFMQGYRESNSVKSTVQPAGRVNRNSERRYGNLFIFEFLPHPLITVNVQFNESSRILQQVLAERDGLLSPDDCTDAVYRELMVAANHNRTNTNIEDVKRYEKFMYLRLIRETMVVIEHHNVTVLAHDDIFRTLARGDIADRKVGDIYKELMEKSFTVYFGKMPDPKNPDSLFRAIALADVTEEKDFEYEKMNKFDGEHILVWNGGYDDDLLGYMSEILFQKGVPGVERGRMVAENTIRDFWEKLGMAKPMAVSVTVRAPAPVRVSGRPGPRIERDDDKLVNSLISVVTSDKI